MIHYQPYCSRDLVMLEQLIVSGGLIRPSNDLIDHLSGICAMDGEITVGAVLFTSYAIEYIVVAKDHRRQGTGTNLRIMAEDSFRAAKKPILLRATEASLAYYRRNGYCEVGMRHGDPLLQKTA